MAFDQITNLDELKQAVLQCQRCGLRSGCSGLVFGEGSQSARIVLCGEGPGAEEDRLLRPFVGAAGQLLDKILEACGFGRFEHVFILNVIKCRPPGNRVPTEDERKACLPNLEAQLRILKPEIIVLMGATAVQTMIDPQARITKLRGDWIQRNGVWYMPTYHPAALLRTPSLKKDAWHDFKLVIDKYRELVDPAHQSPHHSLSR